MQILHVYILYTVYYKKLYNIKLVPTLLCKRLPLLKGLCHEFLKIISVFLMLNVYFCFPLMDFKVLYCLVIFKVENKFSINI